MNEHLNLAGDGIFIIKEENSKVVITLCAWTTEKETEIIQLLDKRKDTEIRIHNMGYIYEKEKPKILLSLTKI